MAPAQTLTFGLATSGTEIFNEGFIEFSLSSPVSGETLSAITSSSASSASGALSIVGTAVYLGNGTSATAIGTIDGSQNGSSGILRINLLNPGAFSNGDFSNGTLTQVGSTNAYTLTGGWTVYKDRFQLGITSVSGFTSPQDSTPATNAPSSGGLALDTATATSSDFSLAALSAGRINLPLSGVITPGFGVLHGPYVTSAPTYIAAGSSVSFKWEAISAGDAYDVYAYLQNVDNGSSINLLNATGANASSTSPQATVTTNVPNAGNYVFVFVSGSWDASGGTVLGASLNIDDVSISPSPTPLNITPATLNGLSNLIQYNNTATSHSARTVSITATESTANGSSSLLATSNVSALAATTSGGGGGGDTPPQTTDLTPVDPAPAGSNFQRTDADNDGIREVTQASDGLIVDGNKDGVADWLQSDVAGLRLINDGSIASDYGALVVSPNVRLRGATLTEPNDAGALPVNVRSGCTVTTTTPDGISNAFAGVLSFTVSGVTPGDTTQATITFPSGLPANTGNAYVRFNYTTNRFEEYVDAAGNPLYSFVDSDGDGVFDAVNLTLVDGDPNWDGDGEANGTVVDPGFLAVGERTFLGTNRKDTLTGNVLANSFNGKKGNDWLQGGLGIDVLIGGRGNDRYVYTITDESTTTQRDSVKFGKGDRFVFSSFDGDTITEGQQKLRFIGKQAFSGVAGELRATRSVLEADLNGDSLAEFAVNLRGNSLISSSNLVL